MYSRNGKPATLALSYILKQIDIPDTSKKIVWEQRKGWQGSTVKYRKSVIDIIAEWLRLNNYPEEIITDKKTYKVKYEPMNI